jgi:ribonuclease HI
MQLDIYTDGSQIGGKVKGKGGVGGWAFVFVPPGNTEEYMLGRGGELETTSQRMELTAAAEALRFVNENYSNVNVTIHTDSQYLRNGMDDHPGQGKRMDKAWVIAWVKDNWIKWDKKPVLNKDLWVELLELRAAATGSVKFVWVAGHNGDLMNELADHHATQAANDAKKNARRQNRQYSRVTPSSQGPSYR